MTIFFFFYTIVDKSQSCLNYTLLDYGNISTDIPLPLPLNAIIAANSRGQ